MLCVQSGRYKQQRLYSVQQLDIRPTKAMVRHAIFSMLKSRFILADFIFCDLFAGSGAVGIEAYSCGVPEVLFLEKQPKHCDLIRRNLKKLGLGQACKVHCADALEWLRVGVACQNRILFFDPPHQGPQLQQAFLVLKQNLNLFNQNLVLVEYPTKTELDCTNLWQTIQTKTYGNTQIILGQISS